MANVRFQVTGLKEALDKKVVKVLNKAAARSINTALFTMQSQAKKEISKQIGIKQKDIKGFFKIKKATSKTLEGQLDIADKKVSLSKLKLKSVIVMSARGKRKGVSVTVNGRTQIIPGGFLVRLRQGDLAVFRRVGRNREPIKKVAGDLLSTMMNLTDLVSRLRKVAIVSFQKNFTGNFKFYSDKEKK